MVHRGHIGSRRLRCGLVFFGNGMRCPLTALAQRYGDEKGYVGETLFPQARTRYTFRASGTVYAIGVILIAMSYVLS